MSVKEITERQAIILMLIAQYRKSGVDPLMDDFGLNLIGYLVDSAIAQAENENQPDIDIYMLDVFGSLEGHASRETVLIDEFKILDISITEETEAKALTVLEQNSKAREVFEKVSSTIEGCESNSSLCLFYETHQAMMNGSETKSVFSDFEANFATGRFADNGWVQKT